MQPFHERALNGLRDVANALAFLLAPLQAYDAAHDYPDEDAVPDDAFAPVLNEEQYRLGETTWTIRIYDDQPIADGHKYAADVRVVLLRDGKQVREFTYPSYRRWTLLAHWTEGLADIDTEKEPNA